MALVERAFGAPRLNGVRRLFLLCLLGALSSAAADDRPAEPAKVPADQKQAGDAAAPQPQPGQGFLVRVNLPISGDVDIKVQTAVRRLLGGLKPSDARPVLVVELWPGQVEGGTGSDFYRAMSLARFLSSRDLAGLKTVAYIPKTVKGHAVLAAMACEEIIMAPDAEIGAAGIDEQVIGPTVRSGYKEIADARRTIPSAIALAMLDPSLKALKVSTEVGTEYVLEGDLDELKQRRVVQSVEELKPHPLLVDGRRARQDLGFVSYLAEDRADVARALKLPRDAMQDNPELAGGWRPVQVSLKGPVNPTVATRIQRLITDQIRDNDVNLIVLWIESDGGSFNDSMNLATYLSKLDAGRVRTVAYIPKHARGDAALVALACDQIVMQADAIIGGAGADVLKADAVPLAAKALREILSRDAQHSWSLAVAMVDPQLKVYAYSQPTTGMTAYFSEQEAAEQPDPGSWKQGELISGGAGGLQLSGRKAEQMGVAWKLVDGFDQFKQVYGLERNPALVEPGWADFLIDALASDGARMFLLILGFAGLYLEIHTPGIGVGGFVAMLAFMLYFWAQYLQGTAAVLEIMLFLVGILCLALEAFVIPGFGIFGLGGGLLIIVSIVLASQTFIIPANEYQFDQVLNSGLVLAGATAGCIAVAAALRNLLPRAPMLNRMMLEPMSSAELEALAVRESLADYTHLLGQEGVATTPLMLSGKARVGDELVDVVADGDAIDRGARVVVVDVTGSRVVVREVEEA